MDNIQYTQKEGGQILMPVYEGRTIDQMPKLIEACQTPISLAGIMDLRNAVFESGNKHLIKQVCETYIDSGDGIVYDSKTGDLKINLDSQNLRNLTPSSEENLNSFNGYSALNLEKEKGEIRFADLPDEVDGVQLRFTPKEIEEFTCKYLTEGQVPTNKFWLAFARGDEERLGTYVQNVYSRTNDPELMQVWVTEGKPEFEAERLWCLGGLDGISGANGNLNGQLDYDDGRLVGVAPEVPSCIEIAHQ